MKCYVFALGEMARLYRGNPSDPAYAGPGKLRLSPVAALTLHRSVIHYRHCASLTLYTREALATSFACNLCKI